MNRTIPFDETAECDWCGAIGAFDFMGDFACPNCAASILVFEDGEDSNVLEEKKPEETNK